MRYKFKIVQGELFSTSFTFYLEIMDFRNKSANCYNFFSDRIHISRSVAFSVSFLCACAMLTGGASNFKIIMIYCMNTKFIGKVASFLTFLLALSDISITLVVMPFILILFLEPEKFSCGTELTAQFLSNFFSRSSGYVIFLIGFDRLLHATYLMDYKQKVTNRFVFWMVSLALTTSLACAVSLTVVSYRFGRYFPYAVLIVTCLDLLLLVLVMGTYIKVYNGFMKRMNDTQRNYSNFSSRLGNTVMFVLMSTSVCYLPYIIASFIWVCETFGNPMENRSSFIFSALYYSYCFLYSNATLNAWLVICRRPYL